MSILSERITQLRKIRGYTQKQVCDALGIETIQVLSNYEHDRRKPNIDLVAEFAIYYNVSADYLLGITEYENPANANIRDRLGLSDGAIQELERMNRLRTKMRKSALIETINELIERGEKYHIFNLLYQYFSGAAYQEDELDEDWIDREDDDEDGLIDKKDDNQLLEKANDDFYSLLTEFRPVGIDYDLANLTGYNTNIILLEFIKDSIRKLAYEDLSRQRFSDDDSDAFFKKYLEELEAKMNGEYKED